MTVLFLARSVRVPGKPSTVQWPVLNKGRHPTGRQQRQCHPATGQSQQTHQRLVKDCKTKK